jgi:hypothetical protein
MENAQDVRVSPEAGRRSSPLQSLQEPAPSLDLLRLFAGLCYSSFILLKDLGPFQALQALDDLG